MNSGAPYAAVVGAPFMGTPHGGYVHRNATSGLQEVKKSNLVATTDPAVGDDTDDGYAVGSQWINVSSGSVFTCTNAAAGAANWTLLGGGSGVGVPAGTGTEVQYRVNATTFGAVTGSSWDATTLTLPKSNFSGVVGLAAGSASAPSLAFSGDTDTGFYWNSANKIGVCSAGTEMFTISTASGITPTIGSTYGVGGGSLSWLTGLFDRINANLAGNNKTVFNMSSGGTYYGAIMVDPAGVTAGSWSLGYSAAATNAYGTPVLTWTGAGNVGIGTSNPTSKLHVVSSATGSYPFTIINYGGTNSLFNVYDNAGNCEVYVRNSAGTVAHQICASSNAVVFNEQGADLDFRIEGDTSPNLFVVDASADCIGILTNTPTNTLQIGSNVATGWAGNALLLGGATNNLAFTDVTTHYQVNCSGSLGFYRYATLQLYLTAAGNVGIGTNAPASKLHVIATTEQLRLGYDATYYTSFTVNNAGDLTIAPSGANLAVTADVDVPSNKSFYLGAPATDGTWRITRSGNNLLMERRESGAYVTKQTIAA
jgi:hypothetical protein